MPAESICYTIGPQPLEELTMRLLRLLVLGVILLIPSLSEAAWYDDEYERPWTLSIAPAYNLLYLSSESDIRHGGGARLLASYRIKPNWTLELRGEIFVNDGDSARDQGIYSQISFLPAARYTILTGPYQPYVFLGFGYMRTELDRETWTEFINHSIMIEGGAGAAFQVVEWLWLGVEVSAIPILLGKQVDGSAAFRAGANVEFRF